MYAKRLTKEDLIQDGISIELDEATSDIKVCRNGKSVKLSTNKQGYFGFSIYDRDEKGDKIKKPAKYKRKGKIYDYYVYKMRMIPLHRAVYAWVNGEVPEGRVVDHIKNKHDSIEDYWPTNLQLLTPKQNVNKERICNVRELKCDMRKPRSFYEERLKKYEALHEQAKKEGQAEEAHKQRANVANLKAKLRYFDSHVEEFAKYNANLELKKYIKGQIADLFKEIEEQKENNIVCKKNGWNYFWHVGCWLINGKRDKIRELKKELRNLK